MSKFDKAEFWPYFWHFRYHSGKDAFRAAVERHYFRNPHHPSYWDCGERRDNVPASYPLHVVRNKDGEVRWVTVMPPEYVREMVADWAAAGWANGKPDMFQWWADNAHKLPLHPESYAAAEILVLRYQGQIGRWVCRRYW